MQENMHHLIRAFSIQLIFLRSSGAAFVLPWLFSFDAPFHLSVNKLQSPWETSRPGKRDTLVQTPLCCWSESEQPGWLGQSKEGKACKRQVLIKEKEAAEEQEPGKLGASAKHNTEEAKRASFRRTEPSSDLRNKHRNKEKVGARLEAERATSRKEMHRHTHTDRHAR